MEKKISEYYHDLKLIKEDIYHSHLLDLAFKYGEKTFVFLLNLHVSEPNFSVELNLKDLDLEEHDYEELDEIDLKVSDYWLSYKKTCYSFDQLKKIIEEFAVKDIFIDSDEIHLILHAHNLPDALTLCDVHDSINRLSQNVKEKLKSIGIEDYHVKYQIYRYYNERSELEMY